MASSGVGIPASESKSMVGAALTERSKAKADGHTGDEGDSGLPSAAAGSAAAALAAAL
eukprot:CAMPEP_0119379666 /NCGR_PEP_ID=MMETSP1334-20130426/53693_1 /TAXON_ID=127549 /ORGANISM="Calcidiscus leptoporus, Strain RCC1130" /LENGTH=57 /DNA_ID=CAMNT_0007399249 /DNA_START=3 /DNA_END=172 /DNA_ORIENTATION=-